MLPQPPPIHRSTANKLLAVRDKKSLWSTYVRRHWALATIMLRIPHILRVMLLLSLSSYDCICWDQTPFYFVQRVLQRLRGWTIIVRYGNCVRNSTSMFRLGLWISAYKQHPVHCMVFQAFTWRM